MKTPRGRFEALIKTYARQRKAAGEPEMPMEPVVIEGYASTPHQDRGDDVVLPSAFNATLETYMTNPVLLWDHGRDPEYGYKPIGQVTEASVDNGGLRIKAEITDEDIGGMVERGELRTLSFGYEVPEDGMAWQEQDGKNVRVITTLELYEISVVAIPMNPNARFSLAKSLKAYFAEGKALDEVAAKTNAPLDVPLPTTPEPMPEEKTEIVTEEVAPVPETPVLADPVAEVVEDVKTDDTPVEVPTVETAEPADTAEATPPSDEKSVTDTNSTEVEPPAVETVEEKAEEPSVTEEAVTPEVKSLTQELPQETKAVEDKTVALEAKLADAEAKALASQAEIARLADESKKADQAMALLTDRLLSLEQFVKTMPVNKPYAVSQFPTQAKKHADTEFRIVPT